MKKSLLIISFFAGLIVKSEAQKMSKEEYINTYKDISIKEMKRCKIPASITLAQGILESAYGNSELAAKSNNHFGIKCHNDWGGKRVYHDDDEKHECFRKYKKPEESFYDHSDFLMSKSRYASLFKLQPTDYKGWAKGLKKAGYATNPKYPQLLIDIIERYELYNYDIKDKELQKHTIKEIAHTEIFEYNRIKTVLVKDDDTYEKLAIKHNVPIRRLLKYNDLNEVRVVKEGEKVFLQPKRKIGPDRFHVVKEWENLYDISQKYGIAMKYIQKRNLLKPGQEPEVGEKVVLRGVRSAPPKLHKPESEKKLENHVVQQGDTLYSIAKKYNIKLEELKRLNGMKDNNISIGDKLVVRK